MDHWFLTFESRKVQDMDFYLIDIVNSSVALVVIASLQGETTREKESGGLPSRGGIHRIVTALICLSR